MKTKKPTEKKVSSTVATVLAVIVGMKASKAASSILPVQSELAKKGIIIGAGALAALFVDGEDLTSKIIQGIGAGMIVQQGSDAIDGAVQSSLPASTTTTTKAINAAFGNQTVSASPALAARRRRHRSMGNPVFNNVRLANPAERIGGDFVTMV